jgi:Leucine-rich repeat (LRR) protein
MPEPKTPEQLVSEFLQMSSFQRGDDVLAQVAALGEGRERIVNVDLTRSPVSNQGLKAIAGFPEMRLLNLTATRITDAALSVLPECKHLETLILDEAGVTSAGMAFIGQTPWLKSLSLQRTPITDADLTYLKGLPALEVLRLDGNSSLFGKQLGEVIDGKGLPSLREFTLSGTQLGFYGLNSANDLRSLEVFRANQAAINDQVLLALSKCPKLRVVIIGGNPVTNEGMKHMSKCKTLEELIVVDCRAVTDISFNYLKVLKGLKKLDVSQTSCTPQAVKVLADKFLTETDVVYNGQGF